MPRTLEKTRKQVAKKRNGVMDSLHERSRDARRLNRAQVRDERLERIADSRLKRDQPIVDRVSYFQEVVRENGEQPLALEVVRARIQDYVRQHDEELEMLKKARRPGRPPSAKEDMLKLKISALRKEEQNGFYIPDLTTKASVEAVARWEGSWSYLTNVSWVRVSGSGEIKTASFPPNGATSRRSQVSGRVD